jgi:hypothetical protein
MKEIKNFFGTSGSAGDHGVILDELGLDPRLRRLES